MSSLEELVNVTLPLSDSPEPELEQHHEPVYEIRRIASSSGGASGSEGSSSKMKMELTSEDLVMPKEEEIEHDERLLSSSNPSLGSSAASDASEAVAPAPVHPLARAPALAPSIPMPTKMRTRTTSAMKSGLPTTTKTEMEEAKRQVEIVGSQMRALREEFEECMKLLSERDGELRETKGQLVQTQGLLEVREGELRATRGDLDEEIVVRTAFQDSEANMNAVALSLKKAAEEGRIDIEGLFAKLGK